MIGPLDIDRPEIRAEVSTAFLAYEEALRGGATAALDSAFWDSPDVVRYGIADRQKGIDGIRRWRAGQGPLTDRTLSDTTITTFGDDVAVVTTLFAYPGSTTAGRQSQTWVRTSAGWRIVSAHVSYAQPADPGRPLSETGEVDG
ncbi:MAG: oxalurate catabolism protein HpxZ [Acidobacteriota bacterium]|nr:oxalurate catabolism protein HpxZ [Acidobacteriota bacterium]